MSTLSAGHSRPTRSARRPRADPSYMSYQQFCLRICIAEEAGVTAALQCQHTLDEMGCAWVMPGDYTNNSFTDCKADPAFPPGMYLEANGSTSTFAQRYTLTQTQDGHLTQYTIGYTVTPSTAYSTPASSECTTYSTVGNGIPPAALSSGAAFSYTPGMTFDLPSDAVAPSATAGGGHAKAGSGAEGRGHGGAMVVGMAVAGVVAGCLII